MSSGQMVSPPREEDFANNELEEGEEEKMDMSLDEIIKLNRDTMMQSPVRSNTSSHRSDRPPRRDARDAIRRSAASRSAAIRQGKVPERRNGNFFSGTRPYHAPIRSRVGGGGSGGGGGGGGGRNDMFKRSGLPRKHLVPGDRVDIYEGGAGKLKISVVNENSKPAPPPVHRPPPPSGRNGVARMNWDNEFQVRDDLDDDFEDYDRPMKVQLRMPYGSSKMDEFGDVPKRHRTLDSLFASIKEQRELGRAQNFGSGRFRAQSFRKRT